MKTQMELQKYLFGESSSINELNEKQYQNLINNILTKCLNLQGVGCGSQVGLNSRVVC